MTHADITNEEVWEEELFKNFDLVISSTGNQELNLITSMYAKKVGVLRSISLVQTRAYKNIAESLGIDVSISINNVLVNTPLAYLYVHDISGDSSSHVRGWMFRLEIYTVLILFTPYFWRRR